MSFSDMMSSGRGPGVIGMVMALMVLLGFGLLFMFAFDEGLQGGDQSIESVIRNQGEEIESHASGIKKGTETLLHAPERIAASKELARLTTEKTVLAEKITELTEAAASAKAALDESEKTFNDYKDDYRGFVRGKAKGTEMPVLETTTGVVYKNVNIREVSAIGIQIRHDEGQKRIPFEELSEEMKDYYQFDPAQKDQALASETATRTQHEAEVAAASVVADEEMAKQRARTAEATREKNAALLSVKQAQIMAVKREIKALKNELERDSANTGGGRRGISKSGQIKVKLSAANSRLQALQSEVSQLKSQR